MKERLGLRLGIIVGLTLIALYANFDLFRPGFQHSVGIVRLLAWQGEPQLRSLALREGLDLKGGLRVLLQARSPAITSEQMQDDVGVIQRRVDSLGVTEPLVQTQGTDKIVVELPGVSDPDLAVKTIGKTALLEYVYSGKDPLTVGSTVVTSFDGDPKTLFHSLPAEKQQPYQGPKPTALAGAPTAPAPVTATVGAGQAGTATAGGATAPAAGATAGATSVASPTGAGTATAGSATPVPGATATAPGGSETTTIYPSVLTGKNIRNPQLGIDPITNEPLVTFEVDSEGARWLGDFTSKHVGEYMPILLDKEVVSSPTLRDRIADRGQIQGSFDRKSAEALVAQLRSGSLPVPLDVVGQTIIGPTLGQQSIDAAIKGGLLGLLVVMVFMLLYYRLPGLLADLALTLYALFSLTIFRAFPVTLTLAGIAGFVLSIGMAVDANILIFERMKEELRAGRRIRQAIDVGFSRAWPSIRDSNTSTLITCAILFWFGNQFGATIVKGFAITLAIGVLVSMFTAIFVTRTFLMVMNRWAFHDTSDSAVNTPRLRRLFGF
jgi:preprotein translocase subunit SecD